MFLQHSLTLMLIISFCALSNVYSKYSEASENQLEADLSETEEVEYLRKNPRWFEGVWSRDKSCDREEELIEVVTSNSNLFFPKQGGVNFYDNDTYELVEGHAIANSGEWVVRFVSPSEVHIFWPIFGEGETKGVVPLGFDFAAYPEKWEEPKPAYRCEDLPQDIYAIYGDLISAFQFISKIKPVCEEDRSSCVDLVFSFIDVTQDRELSVAEINRVLRIIYSIGFAISSNDKSDLRDKEYLAGYTAIASIGSLFGPLLLLNLDYDGSGKISMDEIVFDRTPLLTGPGLGPSIADVGLSDEIDKGLELVAKIFRNL